VEFSAARPQKKRGCRALALEESLPSHVTGRSLTPLSSPQCLVLLDTVLAKATPSLLRCCFSFLSCRGTHCTPEKGEGIQDTSWIEVEPNGQWRQGVGRQGMTSRASQTLSARNSSPRALDVELLLPVRHLGSATYYPRHAEPPWRVGASHTDLLEVDHLWLEAANEEAQTVSSASCVRPCCTRCSPHALLAECPAADGHKLPLSDGHLKEAWTLEKQFAHILPSWQPLDGLTRVLLQVSIACLGAYLFGYHLS